MDSAFFCGCDKTVVNIIVVKFASLAAVKSVILTPRYVNTPFLTQHHRRIIKPPACTQQVLDIPNQMVVYS